MAKEAKAKARVAARPCATDVARRNTVSPIVCGRDKERAVKARGNPCIRQDDLGTSRTGPKEATDTKEVAVKAARVEARAPETVASIAAGRTTPTNALTVQGKQGMCVR